MQDVIDSSLDEKLSTLDKKISAFSEKLETIKSILDDILTGTSKEETSARA